MQAMPGRRPSFFPPTPQGSSGSSFLPPMASFDPALSATLQGQEVVPMVAQEAAETAWPQPQMPEAAEEQMSSAEDTERVVA